jgi:hypothetical protein
MKSKNFIFLLVFCGAGSKLLQSQLGNSKEMFTIPAYPLLYLYPHYLEWKKKYKNISPSLSLKLLFRFHSPLLDSRKISSFGGLTTLGKKRDQFIKISKEKFEINYLKYLKKEKINYSNIVKAIHFAYQKSTPNKGEKILFHSHDVEWFQKGISKEFFDSKVVLTVRHPLYNFWRRIYADVNIEKERFNYTDLEYLKNFRYLNRVKNFYLSFACLKNNLGKKNSIFVKFEDIKKNNKKVLSRLCKFIGLKFNYKELFIPKFGDKIWWGSSVYKGFNKSKFFVKDSFENKDDFNNFFNYEIIVLEIILYPYMKKFNYNFHTIAKNKNLHFLIFLLILLPTKYGLKIFFQRIKFSSIIIYFKNILNELNKKTLKNYYFNAMYKHKWTYRDQSYITKNFLRKKLFNSKNTILDKITIFIFFIERLLRYFYFEIELFLMYFYRIYFFIKTYFTIKEKINFIN